MRNNIEESIKVYIVDDEPAIVEWLIRYVDWGVYNCRVIGSSTNAKEALTFVGEHLVDLLITDVAMPGISGLELIRFMKRVKPQMSVILISAYNKFDYVKEAIRYGVINYLLKPINISELNECLKVVEGNHAKQLNNYNNQDIAVFRNSILHELISGDMDQYMLEEHCELAGICLRVSFFQVVVISLKGMENAAGFSLTNRLSEGQEEGYYCFLGSRMRLVLLFIGECVGVAKIKKKIAYAVGKERLREPFYCIGKPLSGYAQIPESYRRCCDFLDAEFVFWGGYKYVADYPYEKYQSSSQVGFLKLISDAIYLEDREKLIQLIRKRLESCRIEGEQKQELICLAVYLVKKIRLKYPTLEMPLPNKSLESQQTIEKMLMWIECFYAEILDRRGKQHENVATYVDRALLEIDKNYANKNLSLQQIADKCGITTAYMGQLFHLQTGEFFNDYLLQKRLEEVEILLRETDRSVGDIALATGFSGQSYFNKMFRKVYGISPVEYRNRIHTVDEGD